MKRTGFFILLLVLTCFCSTQESGKQIILPGIFQTESYFPYLDGLSIALIANKTSRFNEEQLHDSLFRSGFNVTKIFTPEHGFDLNFEAGAAVNNNGLRFTEIEIISLYGRNVKPAEEDLQSVDVIIFDLQDVGVRFYTYLSTLHYVMEACAEENIPLIVLDRPNPNGHYIDGPILDTAFRSFIGMHEVPVVYGMTIGEYAQMINGEGWLKGGAVCSLKVVPCVGYTHQSEYEIPESPSPNLPTRLSIELYPTLAFFEGTPVSIGRGTPFPFQVVGHPNYPDKGFTFTPVKIKGKSEHPKFKNQVCFGIDLRADSNLVMLNKRSIDIDFIIKIWESLGSEDEFFTSYFNLLAGTDKLQKQIKAGLSAKQIRLSWQSDLEEFSKIRNKYLIY